jgi:outer membrane biosynthesis protein TonB
MGVKSLSDLRGKTEDQLRKLSADVVSYETRQNMMRTNFSQRADGTFDLTKDASGNPTGLDAQGKSLYNQQPVVPAPTTPKPPATPAKPAAKPKPKPAAKPKPKPAAKKKVTAKPAPKKKPAAKKPAPKPAAKKPAPKPAVKKPATKVTSTYRVSATGTGHGM